MLKKAAMFGLDARIALAIFGALSVISGAALYSAIQEANTTKLIVTFNEILKSSEEFYLRQGEEMYVSGGVIYSGELVRDGGRVTNWQGPYISGTFISNTEFGLPEYEDYSFLTEMKKTSDWTDKSSTNFCTTNNVDCAEWAVMRLSTANEVSSGKLLFDALDKRIDDSDGWATGNVRYLEYTATNHYVLYKGRPRIR